MLSTDGTRGPDQRVFLAKELQVPSWVLHQRLPGMDDRSQGSWVLCEPHLHPCHKMGTSSCLWRCLFAKPGGTLGPRLSVTRWSQKPEMKAVSTSVGVDTW